MRARKTIGSKKADGIDIFGRARIVLAFGSGLEEADYHE
jgi:hypothetical protein